MQADEPRLGKSDETILRALSSGEQHDVTPDWVALQHLRQKGLIEMTPLGPKITDKGRRAISDQ
jgi:hypothetical protein